MDRKIFDNDENQVDDINKNRKKRDEKFINIFTMDLYSYIIVMIYMH